MKISDFGLARTVNSSGQGAVTECGTPLHMSPEIFAGMEYGVPADVWSIGVLFYRITTNGESHPFPAKNIPELMAMINQPIVRDMRFFPSPQADLYWDVLAKMLCIKLSARASIAGILAHPLFAPYRSENDFPPSSKFVAVSNLTSSSPSPKAAAPSPPSSTTSPASEMGFSLLSVTAAPTPPTAPTPKAPSTANPPSANPPSANPFARVTSGYLPVAKRINKAGKAPPLPPPPVV